MRFYISKFVLISAPFFCILISAGAGLFAWLTYVLSTQYNASFLVLLALCAFDVFLIYCVFIFWRKAIYIFQRRLKPVISFEANGVSYRMDMKDLVFTPYSQIRGVEVEPFGPKLGGGNILIHKSDSQPDKVYICNLSASPDDIFAAFKMKLPNLIQPHSTVKQLVGAA